MGGGHQPERGVAPDGDLRVLNSPSATEPTATPSTTDSPQQPTAETAQTQSPTRASQSEPSAAPAAQQPDTPSYGPDNRQQKPDNQTAPDTRASAPVGQDNRANTPGHPTHPNNTAAPANPQTQPGTTPTSWATPTHPGNTAYPAQPTGPANTGNPTNTGDPHNPTNPNTPQKPSTPSTPTHPGTNAYPTQPNRPGRPDNPFAGLPDTRAPMSDNPGRPHNTNPTRPEHPSPSDNTDRRQQPDYRSPHQNPANPTNPGPNPYQRSSQDFQNWFNQKQREYDPNNSPWATQPTSPSQAPGDRPTTQQPPRSDQPHTQQPKLDQPTTPVQQPSRTDHPTTPQQPRPDLTQPANTNQPTTPTQAPHTNTTPSHTPDTPKSTEPNTNRPDATKPDNNRPADPSTPNNTKPDTTTPDNTTKPDTDPTKPTPPPNTHHTPTSTSIGDDPTTHRVRENLRNEGDFDVIFHADTNGAPLNNLTPQQIADAIRNNPNYTPGTPIRLIACNTAHNPDLAQQLANELGVPVHAPTDAVGIPTKPNSPAHVRDNGTWTTHHPTNQDGTTPSSTTRDTSTRPDTTNIDSDQSIDYMGETPPPQDPQPRRTMDEKLQDPDYRRKYYREYPDGSVRVKNGKTRDPDGDLTPPVTVDDSGRWVVSEGLISRVDYDTENQRDHPSPNSPKFNQTPTNPTPEDVRKLFEVAQEYAAARTAALSRLDKALNGDDFVTARDTLLDRIENAEQANDTAAMRAAEAELVELRQAAVGVRDEGENLGEAAARHAIAAEFPPSQGWQIMPLHEQPGINEGPKQGRFDHIYRVTDKDGNERYVVYEAKGPRAQLGARGGHEQGTSKYFDSIIEQMRAGTQEEKDLAEKLADEKKKGKLTYAAVQAQVNPDNSYKGARVKPFKLR